MDYILSKFRIRPGKLESSRAFLTHLHENQQKEMLAVLVEANMTIDCTFIESSDSGDFLYIFKRIANHDTLVDAIQDSNLPIYKEIREWANECLSDRQDLEAISAFDAI